MDKTNMIKQEHNLYSQTIFVAFVKDNVTIGSVKNGILGSKPY